MRTNKPPLALTSATLRSKQPMSHNTPHLARLIYMQSSATQASPHPTQPSAPHLLLTPHLTPLHPSPRPPLPQQTTSNPTQSAPLTIGRTPTSFPHPRSISLPHPRNHPTSLHPWAEHHSAPARKLHRDRARRAGPVSPRNVRLTLATDPPRRIRAPPPLHHPFNHFNSNHNLLPSPSDRHHLCQTSRLPLHQYPTGRLSHLCNSRHHTPPHPRHQQLPRSLSPGPHHTQPNSTTIHYLHRSPNPPALFLATRPNHSHTRNTCYHHHNHLGHNESNSAKKNTAPKMTHGATMVAAGNVNKEVCPTTEQPDATCSVLLYAD